MAGIGDITHAFVVFGYFGARPLRILQGIAGRILGARSWQMGWTSAALGLVLHFTIAITAVVVYWVASRWMRIPVDRPVLFGLVYGEVVFLFMYFVVLPLSALGPAKFGIGGYITGRSATRCWSDSRFC